MTIDEFLKTLESSATQSPEQIAVLRDELQVRSPERNGSPSHTNGGNGRAIQIGPCQILSTAETDTKGVTFLGQHFENGHEMTVRMVFPKSERPFLGTEEEHAARQKFAHPSQTPVLAVEQMGEFLCLCRDATGGETLTSIVSESGPFPAEAAIECVSQAARYLQEARDAGFVNGELHESQWILDDDGRLWLNPDQPFLQMASIPDATERLAADRESLRSLWILLTLGITAKEYWSGCSVAPLSEPLNSEFWNEAKTVGDVLAKLDPTYHVAAESYNEFSNGTASTDERSDNYTPAASVERSNEVQNGGKAPSRFVWIGGAIAVLAIIGWWLMR